MKRPFLWFISLILIISSLVCLRLVFAPLITNPSGIRYVLKPGTSVQAFVNDLTQKNIISYPLLFKALLYASGEAHKLKAGEYYFANGTKPLQMIKQVGEGKGMIYHSITLVPGWSIREVRAAISANVYLQHRIQKLNDNQLMARLGIARLQPEGQFFPDTYYFTEGSSDIALLKRAYFEMQVKLDTAWQSRAAHLPFKNSYEVLIAASLIEKEAYLKTERRVIAGVLINRLYKNMILQFDPTVIYGMGLDYHGVVKKSDLAKNTPYNTYKHKGLPPTPIAMPSLDSIFAALHPDPNHYLYFVAKGDGSHQFSTTLVEHNKAVKEAKKEAAKNQKGWLNQSLLKLYFINLRYFQV